MEKVTARTDWLENLGRGLSNFHETTSYFQTYHLLSPPSLLCCTFFPLFLVLGCTGPLLYFSFSRLRIWRRKRTKSIRHTCIGRASWSVMPVRNTRARLYFPLASRLYFCWCWFSRETTRSKNKKVNDLSISGSFFPLLPAGLFFFLRVGRSQQLAGSRGISYNGLLS